MCAWFGCHISPTCGRRVCTNFISFGAALGACDEVPWTPYLVPHPTLSKYRKTFAGSKRPSLFPFSPLLPPRHTPHNAAPCARDETELAPVVEIDDSLLRPSFSLLLSNSGSCEIPRRRRSVNGAVHVFAAGPSEEAMDRTRETNKTAKDDPHEWEFAANLYTLVFEYNLAQFFSNGILSHIITRSLVTHHSGKLGYRYAVLCKM